MHNSLVEYVLGPCAARCMRSRHHHMLWLLPSGGAKHFGNRQHPGIRFGLWSSFAPIANRHRLRRAWPPGASDDRPLPCALSYAFVRCVTLVAGTDSMTGLRMDAGVSRGGSYRTALINALTPAVTHSHLAMSGECHVTQDGVVELSGVEPLTSSLRTKRSTN